MHNLNAFPKIDSRVGSLNKKLGIIGGAGPLASSLLYETLIQESYALKRQVPEILLINFPFTRGLSLEEGQKNEKTIENELSYCIKLLIQSGVGRGVLACNTLHLILNKLPQTSIIFHQLPQLVVHAAQERKHHRLLILATANTCSSSLYQLAGMQAIYPSVSNQKVINAVIDRVLEGNILQEDALLVSQVIQQTMASNEFDGVVLGCTDFPVLHHRFPIPCSKPIYDSIKISAKTIAGTL